MGLFNVYTLVIRVPACSVEKRLRRALCPLQHFVPRMIFYTSHGSLKEGDDGEYDLKMQGDKLGHFFKTM